jgi:proteasome lid subunit RPN8/RPN11
VKIARKALAQVHEHASEGYPNEICGILVGPRGSSRVTDIRRARNTVTDRARDRYEIDPLDHIRVQRECDSNGLEIVGYYHSHPDQPAQASVFDAERSWAGPFYLIVSVDGGKVVDANGFVAREDGGPFRAEPVEVL